MVARVEDRDELGWRHDPDVADAVDLADATIAGDEVVGAAEDSVGEEVVVLAVVPDFRKRWFELWYELSNDAKPIDKSLRQ